MRFVSTESYLQAVYQCGLDNKSKGYLPALDELIEWLNLMRDDGVVAVNPSRAYKLRASCFTEAFFKL